MRVVLLSHRYPPHGTAGTERYAENLARGLVERGHEVHVLAARKDVSRPDLSLEERTQDGVRVHELTQNLFHEDFAETWSHAGVEGVLGPLLARLAPDVVHVQHLMYLSAGLLARAAATGAALLWTLHDFWLECPRFGQLVHPDGGLCERVSPERCGTCLPTFAWRQPRGAGRVGAALAGVRRATGVDLAPLARRAAQRLRPAGPVDVEGGWAPPPAAEAARFAALVRRRRTELGAASAHVARFLCPSAFLAARMVAFGLPTERVFHVPSPGPAGSRSRPRRAAEAPLRVLFLGTLVPLKGAHVLLEAWGALAPELRARGTLVLHGPADHAPDYVEGLRRRAAEVGARLGAVLDRSAVANALARADVLCVPSLWFENQPLVLLEARAAGVPVLVSDLGGMAELVTEGRHGWRLPAGEVQAWSARLAALLADPAQLTALDPGADPPPEPGPFLDAVLAHYAAARGAGGSAT